MASTMVTPHSLGKDMADAFHSALQGQPRQWQNMRFYEGPEVAKLFIPEIPEHARGHHVG